MEDAWSGLFLICSSNPSAYLQCVLRIHKETFRSKTTICKPSIHTGEENKPLMFCTTVSWIRRSFTSFSRETQNFVSENPTEGMDDACSGLFLICSSNPSAYLRCEFRVYTQLFCSKTRHQRCDPRFAFRVLGFGFRRQDFEIQGLGISGGSLSLYTQVHSVMYDSGSVPE